MLHTEYSSSDFERLVTRCKSLPPPQGNYLIHDYVENLLLTVLDFQMLETTIHRAMQNYRQHARREIADFTSLKNLLARYPDTKDGNLKVAQTLWRYNLWTRVALLRNFVAYFEARGVITQERLKEWASKVDFKQDFNGKVKGAGFAIFQWLVMRQGVETVKPDIWIHRFIQNVLGYSVDDKTAVELLEQVAQEIGVKAYELDWRIWEYQRAHPG